MKLGIKRTLTDLPLHINSTLVISSQSLRRRPKEWSAFTRPLAMVNFVIVFTAFVVFVAYV